MDIGGALTSTTLCSCARNASSWRSVAAALPDWLVQSDDGPRLSVRSDSVGSAPDKAAIQGHHRCRIAAGGDTADGALVLTPPTTQCVQTRHIQMPAQWASPSSITN